MRIRTTKMLLVLALGSALVACGVDAGQQQDDPRGAPPLGKGDNGTGGGAASNDPPLSKLGDVLDDPNACQPNMPCKFPENKPPLPTDADPPAKFDLLNKDGEPPLQSSVKSQGRRGVCSIFANIALMEHLYLKARQDDPTLAARIPETVDLSEQYLQWSVKFEVNSFPNSSGSNAYYNLTSLSRYGVVTEKAWPYEPGQWGSSDDEKCTGEDDQPTHCYTNGHPSDEVKAKPKYKLPTSRSLSARRIRNHIYENETAVVIGLKFFYQSWNHRKSRLTTNRTYWSKGYVLYPNADDEDDSSGDRRAGHGILIVGWDNDKEIAIVDKDGKATCDDADATKVDPISGSCPEGSKMLTEKGFYVFKNSWGLGNFGADSDVGDGYGYISMRYVHEYASARVAGLPTPTHVPKPETTEPVEKTRTFSGTVTKGETTFHEVDLGANAKEIVVTMKGTNDADLYTRFEVKPDPSAGRGNGYECRPWKNGSDETCDAVDANGRKFFVAAHGYARGESKYEITVTWKE